MRTVYLTVFLWFMVIFCSAQDQKQFKENSGLYGGNEGICLFEDGRFVLYGYATAIFGHYKIDQDRLFFYPDKFDLFEVMAHHNPTLGVRSRMVFMGFEEGITRVKLDQDSVRRVFNDDANCFDHPFVKENAHTPAHIRLYGEDHREDSTLVSWDFVNDKGYNEFVLLYHKPRREYEDFVGMLNKQDGQILGIRLSNYGGSEGYRKQNHADANWNDILQMKEMNEASVKSANEMLCNKEYATFEVDLSAYQLDQNSNQYVHQHAADNEEYFQSNSYEDNRFLRRFIKLKSLDQNKGVIINSKLASVPIFYTACDDPEKSYRYDRNNKNER